MAAETLPGELSPCAADGGDVTSIYTTYLGASFAVFLGLLPCSSISYLGSLQSRSRILALKLFEAEDQLKQIKCRRREDSKANARVAEILAGQRNSWQQEERRLLARIDAAEAENAMLRADVTDLSRSEAELRAEVERLRREIGERDEMLDFIARGSVDDGDEVGATDLEDSDRYSEYSQGFSAIGKVGVPDREGKYCFDGNGDLDEMADLKAQYYRSYSCRFSPPLPASQPWMDRSSGWKDMQYDSLESTYHMKHFVARRESPWKVDGESTGVSSKLKLLEHELSNLENVIKGDLSKIPSLMRKQAKRYQFLAQKIDDLCQKIRAGEPAIDPEFRTQRQAEFFREALCLQTRAKETRQKLSTLQVEAAESFQGSKLSCQANLSTKRSLDLIRNNLREIQRNMEIWLARIVGDLDGILATDSKSRIRDYYLSRYPFIG